VILPNASHLSGIAEEHFYEYTLLIVYLLNAILPIVIVILLIVTLLNVVAPIKYFLNFQSIERNKTDVQNCKTLTAVAAK
jgi:hypothetical protein